MEVAVNSTRHLPNYGFGPLYICLALQDIQRVYSDGVFFNDSPFLFSLPVLLFQIMALFVVSRALYFLLRPLRQSRIVCNILAGIILGPSMPQFWRGGLRSDYYMAFNLFPTKQKMTLRTLGTFGMMYQLFLIGVKIDVNMVRKIGRRAIVLGLFSVLIPFVMTYFATRYFRHQLHAGSFLIFIPASFSTTSFPVVADILSEIHLLNSELGRLALSASIINDLFGWFFIVAFMTVNQTRLSKNELISKTLAIRNALYTFGAWILVMLLIIFVFRRWVIWVIRNTPRGGRVHDSYIMLILVLVMVMGLLGDVIGVAYITLPLVLGLVVPDGPPLGAALVQYTEMAVTEILLPLFFLTTGQMTNIREVLLAPEKWVTLGCYVLLFSLGVIGTMASAVAVSRYVNISIVESLLLGLMLNFKGLVEILVYMLLSFTKAVDEEKFTVLVMLVVLTSGVAVPLVEKYYKPLGSVQSRGRRTVQRLSPHEELRITVCIPTEDSVAPLISLLELTSGEGFPICAYVIHLVELVGAANASLVSHKNKKGFINPTRMDPLLNNFIAFEQRKRGAAAVLPFTAVAPSKTMHHDPCTLAVERNVALVVTPFPRKDNRGSGMGDGDQAARVFAGSILASAPCSVGLLVYQSLMAATPAQARRRIGALFWGGADDREAVAVAARMARSSPGLVELVVVRFVVPTKNQQDERFIGDFMVENAGDRRVVVEEVVVRDVEEIFAAIRSMERAYDVMVVGRRQGRNSMMDDGLMEWTEWKELGVIGDMLAAPDFDCPYPVLVVQQHAI